MGTPPPWHPPVRRPPWMFRGVYSLGQMQNLNRQLFVYSMLSNSDWKLLIKVIPNSWRVPIYCQFPNPLALGRASGLGNLHTHNVLGDYSLRKTQHIDCHHLNVTSSLGASPERNALCWYVYDVILSTSMCDCTSSPVLAPIAWNPIPVFGAHKPQNDLSQIHRSLFNTYLR